MPINMKWQHYKGNDNATAVGGCIEDDDDDDDDHHHDHDHDHDVDNDRW